MQFSADTKKPTLPPGTLRRVHHVALNAKNLQKSRQFYGEMLGLQELTGESVPATLKSLVEAGKVASFVTPDGTVLDLFWEPELPPPDPDPTREFTRANHLSFDVDPKEFDLAVLVLRQHDVPISHGPVSRPTGRGVYFYDPDGFLIEIRCDPALEDGKMTGWGDDRMGQ
ncbi:MAG: VOC family protein [Cyanobacteria bacterium SID2]|nr:VOC family protein [Cyanobacteria bacterium SID2]MBP0006385.1 VOC family protein [Cyanobacteria bacterium SBC]